MTNKLLLLLAGFPLLLTGCSDKKEKIRSGSIVYEIDYPDNKDNFMLYSILPKEMKLDFCDGLIKCTIAKANLVNQLHVDCSKKSVSTYFGFGADQFYVNLEKQDINEMIAAQKVYNIRLTGEKDTLAGFSVKKAIATAKDNPADVIELWYTNEIAIENSNWYNPFKEVPGFLLQYSMDRYDMRMDFRAKHFEEKEIEKSELILKPKGNERTYSDYNSELSGLFKSLNEHQIPFRSRCFSFILALQAQKGVSGVFTYKASISLPDTNVVLKSWEVKVYTNDTIVRVESQTDAIGEQVFIRHMELNKAYLLLKMGDKKFAIQTDLAENQVKRDSVGPSYTFEKKLFGGKKVGGIKAKRYYIVDKGQKEGYYCWFAKKIPNKYLEVYRDIPGLAVDYYLPSADGLIRYELQSFSEENVNRNLFGIPSDYKKVTFEEFVNNYAN